MLFGIPPLCDAYVSDRARKTLAEVNEFIDNEIVPAEKLYEEEMDSRVGTARWENYPQIVEQLKEKAKAKGLWNLFLPKSYKESPGFSNLEYALMAEAMGRSGYIASEIFNCQAPDTGNMELIAKYASPEQKKRWLVPLMDGKIRSAFCMTEKGVSSSDATNIQISMKLDGNEWVIDGRKWWASGAGDPRCEVLLVMGKTSEGSPYTSQSVIIVPRNTPGVTIVRPMHVFGYDDAPHGHMEVDFDNVRVPKENIVWGEGKGFAIIQGRLGPGRIHHCMRSIGSAQAALKLLVERAKQRETFGKKLIAHGRIQHWIAISRIEIEEGRLLVLQAAHHMDRDGPKAALEDIAAAKIEVPNITQRIVDRAIQTFGAEGISQDQPLAKMWAQARVLRLADGPDEVHLQQYARLTASKI